MLSFIGINHDDQTPADEPNMATVIQVSPINFTSIIHSSGEPDEVIAKVVEINPDLYKSEAYTKGDSKFETFRKNNLKSESITTADPLTIFEISNEIPVEVIYRNHTSYITTSGVYTAGYLPPKYKVSNDKVNDMFTKAAGDDYGFDSLLSRIWENTLKKQAIPIVIPPRKVGQLQVGGQEFPFFDPQNFAPILIDQIPKLTTAIHENQTKAPATTPYDSTAEHTEYFEAITPPIPTNTCLNNTYEISDKAGGENMSTTHESESMSYNVFNPELNNDSTAHEDSNDMFNRELFPIYSESSTSSHRAEQNDSDSSVSNTTVSTWNENQINLPQIVNQTVTASVHAENSQTTIFNTNLKLNVTNEMSKMADLNRTHNIIVTQISRPVHNLTRLRLPIPLQTRIQMGNVSNNLKEIWN